MRRWVVPGAEQVGAFEGWLAPDGGACCGRRSGGDVCAEASQRPETTVVLAKVLKARNALKRR